MKVASEVHSRLSGENGAKVLEQMIKDARKDGPMAVAKAASITERIKEWIKDMFAALKETLGAWSKQDLADLSIEDFNNLTLRDLAEGVNPNEYVTEEGDVQFMGSRVDKRMADISNYFNGRTLSAEQQAVVDVYSGKSNNLPISINRADSNIKVVMRQGVEQKAGAKHSLFRHYGTNVGVITSEDIILIPEIFANGERVKKQHGNTTLYEYKQTINGVKYTVLTEVNNRGAEIFDDYYTDRSKVARSSNTQLSAQADSNLASQHKVTQNSANSNSIATNQDISFSIVDAVEEMVEDAKGANEELDEIAEEEAKYAEMDSTIEAADDISNTEEDDDVLYRSDDATKNRIEALFNQAISGEFKGKPISIGTLTDEGKAYLEQISGVAFKGKVDFVLNPSDLIHIYKRHFGENEKDGRNIPLDIEDIRSIVDIISNPDRVIYSVEEGQQERKMFSFLKEVEQGTYNLLEIYSDRKGNLTAKSFYKSKEGVSQRVISLTRTLHSTSETDGATLNDGAKIPQMFETPSVEDNYSREGEGAVSDEGVTMASDPVSKVIGEPRYGRGKKMREYAERQRRFMVQKVQEIAQKLNLDNVEIITDASTLLVELSF